MAHMHPEHITDETVSNAERLLYSAFHEKLDDSYVVFHHAKWQGLDKEGRPRDGEADFIIAHPEYGVLVVEAKGGGIRYDARLDQWASISRDSGVHAIHDPFEQAMTSKYVLRDALKRMRGRQSLRVLLGHAVAFPEVVVPQEWTSFDKPREIILDATSLAHLPRWFECVFNYWRGQSPVADPAAGRNAIDELLEIMARSWELQPTLATDFLREKEQLIRLTEQQYVVLNALNRHRRALICGCAGSGKTMLAVEKARRLEHQGFRVLLTCFNKPLAAYLHAQLKETPNLTISTFLELCQHWAAKANTLPSEVKGKDFFRSQLPEALLRAAERLKSRFDAIIVDEGQDLRPNWWTPLESLLRDPDHGILYIFYDDNQCIYKRFPSFPFQDPPFLLTVNCRNTQSIHTLVSKFYQSEELPIALGPKGMPIEYAFYEGPEDLRPALGKVLHRLINREQIPASAITVLTPFSQSKSRLWEQVSFQGPPLSNGWPAPPDQVKCCTIYEFKGLERTVIILAEMEEAARLRMADVNGLIYVGSSRARNYLIIMLDRQGDGKLHEVLGAIGQRALPEPNAPSHVT